MSPIWSPARGCAALGVILCVAIAAPAQAKTRTVSYDSVNLPARVLAPGGLSFIFRKSTFGGMRMLKVLSTREKGAATLKPASEKELGEGGIEGILGHKADERALYEIDPGAEGEPLIRAACPDSERAWLAFGSLDSDKPLIIHAFGRYGGSQKAHLCATMEFSWHGEWKLPER